MSFYNQGIGAQLDKSIPGRLNKLPKRLGNNKMNEYNDLRYVGLTKPHMLKGIAQHFVERKGFLSELMMYLGRDFNPITAAQKRKKGTASEYEMNMLKNMQPIGNHEFVWRGKSPEYRSYKFTKSVTPVQGTVQQGFGTTEFYIELSRYHASKDDVILLDDHVTQLIITADPQPLPDGTMKCRVRRLFSPSAVHNAAQVGVPVDMMQKGRECAIIYNLKPEASDFGSRIEMTFGEWYRGFMSTQRYEYDLTGLAKHTKLSPNEVAWFSYRDPENGNIGEYWMPVQHELMMRELAIKRENSLFMGLPFLDENGNFVRDQLNRTYYSGTGFYHQCNQRLKVGYNELNNFNFIEDALRMTAYDSDGEKPVLWVMGGMEFRHQFSKLLANEFQNSPEVLYTDANGNLVGAGAANGQGIKTNFTRFECTFGTFIVSDCNYFDNKALPQRRTPDGRNEQSYRAICVNIGDQIGAKNNIQLVTMSERQSVIGKLFGMAEPGPGGSVASTVDAHKEMVLDMAGIAVMNPNCMVEFRKNRPVTV